MHVLLPRSRAAAGAMDPEVGNEHILEDVIADMQSNIDAVSGDWIMEGVTRNVNAESVAHLYCHLGPDHVSFYIALLLVCLSTVSVEHDAVAFDLNESREHIQVLCQRVIELEERLARLEGMLGDRADL